MNQVVIYSRVSSDEQAQRGTSLDDQKDKLQNYCKLKGYHIIKHFQEDYSAKTFERPVFSEFLKFVKQNKGLVNKLLIVRWDRFSRNVLEAYVMLERLSKLGIETVAIEQEIDMSIPENKLLLGIYLTVPEVDNLRRGKNVFNGIRRAMKDGRYVCTAPYGYKYERSNSRKAVLVPDGQKAEFIKEAFQLYATGQLSKEDIRVMLAKKGMKLSKSPFANIFHNPIYCAKITVDAHEKEPEAIINGIHEPLVSEDLYNKVQYVNEQKNKVYPVKTSAKDELPLRRTMVCPLCGRNLTGSASKGRISRVYYYHCQRGCKTRFNALKANTLFSEWLGQVSIKPEYITPFKEAFDKIYKQEEGDRKSDLKRVEAQIKDLEDKVLKVGKKYAEDDLDKETYLQLKAMYNKDLVQLKAQYADLKMVNKEYIDQVERALQLISNLGGFYEESDLIGKQKLLGSIFPEKLIFDGTKYRTYGKNDILELMFMINNDLHKIKRDKSGGFPNLSRCVVSTGIEPVSKV